MKIKELVNLKEMMSKEDLVTSCIKLFGSARTTEILPQIYSDNELLQALELVDKLDLVQDVNKEDVDVNEVLEMTEIEVNEKGEEIMKKQNKVVKAEELDMHIDNDGIDALPDNRVVNSDHGVDNTENNLEWWMLHAKRSERIPVEFRDYINHFDKGVYPGTIRNIYDYFKDGKPRVVVNVNLEPIYSTAEHRGYVIKNCPVFLSLDQFVSICDEFGWDVDDTKGFVDKKVKIVIDYDKTRKSNTYFLQGK